ncbi:hypothetical protein RSSM_03526 [Rhodopirellula sallentina SM41]|uniref:Uncharacterized protein n=1 Tax=Rhodopirellula sallentina SM41 TaxID=1263870 RepID=M5U0N6_9BACT|nr:hypothetical protein RSSM_03526 [Rhodopirellula sallentina SM41]
MTRPIPVAGFSKPDATEIGRNQLQHLEIALTFSVVNARTSQYATRTSLVIEGASIWSSWKMTVQRNCRETTDELSRCVRCHS